MTSTISLFEPGEGLPQVPVPARVAAKVERRRAKDRKRQQKCRARKRDALKKARENVTGQQETVTPDLFSVTVEPPRVTPETEPELRLIMEAANRVARARDQINRESLIRHLNEIARENGWQIFNAARVLETAYETGLLPTKGPEFVRVARDVLELLIERGQH